MKRKLLSLVMALCMIVTLLPVTAFAAEEEPWTADTIWYTQDSTKTEYTLTTADELAGLAQLVNEGNTFKGVTIYLGDDIDLANQEWTPIGKSGANFQGTFDGQNHTISNLTVNQPAKSDMGLFGYTVGGQVKNFTLHNAKVTGYLDVGAVAGTPYTSKYTNIDVTGLIQVEGFSYVGGALGKNAYANLTDVDVTGAEGSYVKAHSIDSAGIWRTYLGGLVGFMGEGKITVSDCDVKIDVTGSTCDIGGILGILHYNNILKNCTYEGSLTLTDPEGESDNEFGALVGVIHNGGSTTTITNCTATVEKATEGGKDVTDSITAHGGFYNAVTGSGNTGNVSVSATINGKDVTADNNVAKIGDEGYKTLAAAIEAANQTDGDSNVTVTITKSGDYTPFTITCANVTVEAADGVEATINISASKTGSINATNVTLKDLNFVSADGTTIFSSGNCDKLTLDGCTFTGNGTGTALFIHQPNVTIDNCKFVDFERGYYTCGDNHAAGVMTFTGNTFTNVRVPIDGYWGKPATDTTKITITGNTFNNGNWDASYIQLWDYAQYAKWANLNGMDGQPLNPDGKSAIVAEISGNTYVGKTVIYATHFDWFSKSNLTLDEASQALLQYRVLVELENAQSATVRNADGSEITAFNETTTSQTRNGKTVIYSICEGDYIFDIKPTNSTEGLVTKEVTLTQPAQPDSEGKNTITVTVEDGPVNVAKVGEVEYPSLAQAIEAAKNGGTVELLANVSIDTWNQVWNVNGMTIEGNNHTITIGAVESGVNGNYLFYGAENLNVSDLAINFSTNGNGFDMVSGKLENVKMYGGTGSYAVFVGTSAAPNAKVEISNCLFNGFKGAAVYSQPAADEKATAFISMDNTAISNCGMAMCSYAQNTVFTNNTITGGGEVSFAAAAENTERDNTYTITGNTFQDAGKIWFYGADLADVTFTKNQVLGNTTVSTETTKVDTALDVSENYWGGEAPSAEQLNGVNVTGSDVYYVRDTMNPEDLNTYVSSSGSTSYAITVEKADNGTVTASRTRASKGLTITLTVKADEGYELDTLTVTDKNGNEIKLTDKGDDKYTFAMPASAVTVEATFAVKTVEKEVPFADVDVDDWFYGAVKYVYDNELMDGTSATTFAPLMTTNRAMIVTILWRLEGQPETEATLSFTDVESGVWYTDAVNWAASKGIVKGYSDTVFAPNDTVTREQLATILYRYAETKGYDVTAKGDLTTFADGANTSSWAAEAMEWAVGSGLLSGKDGGKLDPTGTATRAEVATILMRFVESVSK